MEMLPKDFYVRDVLEVAPDLIGKLLVHRLSPQSCFALRITEVEAYRGEEDTACHARAGRTRRTEPLYGEGGSAYVYLCYGIHNLFNVVTGAEGVPQAVLIRGVEGYSGPGKLTKAMGIALSHSGRSLTESDAFCVCDDGRRFAFTTAKRVGIDYATEYYRDIHWRFILGAEIS